MNSSALFLILICLSPLFQDQWKNVYTESAWAARDQWQKTDVLIKYLSLTGGSKIADIGCHEGYLTIKLSGIVGEMGKVYAVDVEKTKLDLLNANLQKREISNVTVVKGEYDNPLLPLNSLDAVVILDAYHEMNEYVKMLQHIKASLKSGGRLVLCEPIAEERRKLSRMDQKQKHELGMNFALEDLKKAGFSILKQQDPFVDRMKEKGDKMWVVVALRR